MGLEEELRAEIGKWTERLDDALPSVKAEDGRGAGLLANIRAYRRDSGHFLGQGDLVRSFECLVWAWALLEIGRELGHLK